MRSEQDVRERPIAGDVVRAWYGNDHFHVTFSGPTDDGRSVVKFDSIHPNPTAPIEAIPVSCQIPMKKWKSTMKDIEVLHIAEAPHA